MGRPDPRVDPLSIPPKAGATADVDGAPRSGLGMTVEEVRRLLAGERTVPPPANVPSADLAIAELDEPGAASQPPLVEASSSVLVSAAPPTRVTSVDPRYEELERLLDRNDWRGIEGVLGSLEGVGTLPPNLGLVVALAHNEASNEADPEAIQVAIRCMAGLLGTAEDSPMARVLARRLLRKNPTSPRRLGERSAPPARTSLLIVLVTLVLGGTVGWALSIGSWQGIVRALHLG